MGQNCGISHPNFCITWFLILRIQFSMPAASCWQVFLMVFKKVEKSSTYKLLENDNFRENSLQDLQVNRKCLFSWKKIVLLQLLSCIVSVCLGRSKGSKRASSQTQYLGETKWQQLLVWLTFTWSCHVQGLNLSCRVQMAPYRMPALRSWVLAQCF